MFLQEKGYSVTPVNNAEDAIDLIKENDFDLVLLDEMLTGMDGLEALEAMKETKLRSPTSKALVPIGEDNLRIGITKEYDVEFGLDRATDVDDILANWL